MRKVAQAGESEDPLDDDVSEVIKATDWPFRSGPFDGFGQRFVIWTTDGALADFLDDGFSAMRTDVEHNAAIYHALPPVNDTPGFASRDGHRVRRPASTRSELLGRLIWGINQQVIRGGSADDGLVMHAAAVALDGNAILLAAPSESGKTTLATGLVSRSWAYLTDEAAMIRSDLVVEGHAKPLSIDRGSWPLFPQLDGEWPDGVSAYMKRQWHVPGRRIGTVTRTAPLRMLIFPEFQPEASASLEPLTPADAVHRARYSTLHLDERTVGLVRIRRLAHVVESVPAYRLVHNDLATTVEMIRAELEACVGPRQAVEVPHATGGRLH